MRRSQYGSTGGGRARVLGLGVVLLIAGCTSAPASLYGSAGNGPDRAPDESRHFRDHGTGALTMTRQQPCSTFGLDVDDAGYVQARAMLKGGSLPERHGVRVADFVNHPSYAYPAPAGSGPAVHLDGARTPFGETAHLMRVGIRAPVAKHTATRHLVFAVDVSGSMRSEGRSETARRIVARALAVAPDTDVVSLVTFAEEAAVVLRTDVGEGRGAITNKLAAARIFGRSDILRGLEAALAEAGSGPDAVRDARVILLTDGLAVWPTGDRAALETRVRTERERGVRLDVVGLGLAEHGDAHLETLARLGGGRHTAAPPGDERAVEAAVAQSLTRRVVMEDARVQVEFDPRRVRSWRLLGYEDRALDHTAFTRTARAGADLAAGGEVTALYEVRLVEGVTGLLGRLRLDWRDPATLERVRLETALPAVAELDRPFEAASPDLRLAACLAETAELLRGSIYARDGAYEPVIDRLASLEATDPPSAAEALDLARRARDLTNGRHR